MEEYYERIWEFFGGDIFDAVNTKKMNRFFEFLAEDLVWTHPLYPGVQQGKKFYRRFTETIFTAYPDYKLEIMRAYRGEEGWFAVEYLATGTQTSPFHLLDPTTLETKKTVPPTNVSIRIPMMVTVRVEGLFIKEIHIYYDRLSHMKS
ncbi:MAG: ester cyclase [Candidatus Hodarchaeales archaeon]